MLTRTLKKGIFLFLVSVLVMSAGQVFGQDYSADIQLEEDIYAVAVGDTLVVNAIVKNTCVYPLPRLRVDLFLIGTDKSFKVFRRPILQLLQPEKIWAGTVAEIEITEEMGETEEYWLLAILSIPSESKILDVDLAELWVFDIPEPPEPPEPTE